MARSCKSVGMGSRKKLTEAEQKLAVVCADEIQWFKENAYGVEKVAVPERLVPHLLKMAETGDFSFRREVLRARGWAMTHPEKQNYARFYVNWFGSPYPKLKDPVQRRINWEDPI